MLTFNWWSQVDLGGRLNEEKMKMYTPFRLYLFIEKMIEKYWRILRYKNVKLVHYTEIVLGKETPLLYKGGE